MSKTDKDRPFWVQNNDYSYIDHDHRTGECIISNGCNRWRDNRNHYRRCKKRVTVEFECTKQDPYTINRWLMRGSRTCWTYSRECPCPIPDAWKAEDHGCTGRYRHHGCIGHTRIERDETIPCVCDTYPPTPTCYPAWTLGRHYTHGGVPSAFVRAYYHAPERARERELRDLAREYNTYGELEDGDFLNRQARNSARWDYW